VTLYGAGLSGVDGKSFDPSKKIVYNIVVQATTLHPRLSGREGPMTIVHAQLVGDQAVLPRAEFERLMELARQTEPIDLRLEEEDVPTFGIMRLAEQGGAFDWLANEEDVYTVDDLRVRYR
jgi:hypothetical protein